MPLFDPPPPIPKFIGRRRELKALLKLSKRRELSPIGVFGMGGIGKTALVRHFLARRKARQLWVSAYEASITDETINDILNRLSKTKLPHVVVFDGVERIAEKFVDYALTIINEHPTELIYTSSVPLDEEVLDWPHLLIMGLSVDESVELLSSIVPTKIRNKEFRLLSKRVHGHPLMLIMMAELLKSQTIEQVLFQLDGGWNDLQLALPANEKQIVEIVAPKIVFANDAIIERLKRTPEDLHRVSPRKFEELVAQLINDMGWEVELTPQSNDGGKDIMAVLQTDLGKFLCLVEAKHYNPNRPVQVGLVRQLYGTFVDHGANSGMLVTSSTFTKGAREFQSKHEYQLSLKEYSDVVNWIKSYRNKNKERPSSHTKKITNSGETGRH
jgi:restriction system protein